MKDANQNITSRANARFPPRQLQPALIAAKNLRLLLMIIRIRRMVRYHHRILLQRFQRHLHGLFQLRIVASGHRRRIIFHFNVRRDAVILHFPLAVQAVNRHPRRGNAAAIHQRRIVRRCPPVRPRSACRPAGRSCPA